MKRSARYGERILAGAFQTATRAERGTVYLWPGAFDLVDSDRSGEEVNGKQKEPASDGVANDPDRRQTCADAGDNSVGGEKHNGDGLVPDDRSESHDIARKQEKEAAIKGGEGGDRTSEIVRDRRSRKRTKAHRAMGKVQTLKRHEGRDDREYAHHAKDPEQKADAKM